MPAASEPSPPDRTLTPADDGRVFGMRIGQTAELVVPGPRSPAPRVEGSAIELVEVRGVSGQNHREWEIRAVREGTAVVHGGGDEQWSLTFRVRG